MKATGVVWAFETKPDDYVADDPSESPFEVQRTLVFRPRHITRRIIAQAGWFTAHKYIEDKRPGKQRFVTLEKNERYKGRLRRITVPSQCFGQIKRELDRCGLNAANLYADLDGLCEHIGWQYTSGADEQTPNIGLQPTAAGASLSRRG